MKSGTVYYRDIPAGTLVKDDNGYLFRYDPLYFADSSMPDISATLPKTQREYRSKVLFSFFFGLLAEGALRAVDVFPASGQRHVAFRVEGGHFLRDDHALQSPDEKPLRHHRLRRGLDAY